MAEPRLPWSLPSGVRNHLRIGIRLPGARLLVTASTLAILLLSAWASSGVATNPVANSPVSAVAMSDRDSRLPVSLAATFATASATPTEIGTESPSDTPSPEPSASPPSPARTAEPPKAVAFGGRNRFAIPTIGVNSPIGTTSWGELIPDGIWRWPCAGANNVYLLGHAWGVFAPVHDGYHSGLLRPGLIALYADGAGVVHRYRLLWVQDLPVAEWGKGATWAATAGPAITLQTCDGAASDYRIMVRFVPV